MRWNNKLIRKNIFNLGSLVFLLVLVLSPIFYSQAAYNVKVGDKFNFHIGMIKNEYEQSINVQLGDLIFRPGEDFTLKFTLVNPPVFKYMVTNQDGLSDELSLVADILIVNREWDQLRIEYEALGYIVHESSDEFRLEFYQIPGQKSYGYIDARFHKKDGVVKYIYIYNYYELKEIGIYEIEVSRDVNSRKYLWALTSLAIIPIGIGVYFFIKRRKGK
jgi:hypothetical protein